MHTLCRCCSLRRTHVTLDDILIALCHTTIPCQIDTVVPHFHILKFSNLFHTACILWWLDSEHFGLPLMKSGFGILRMSSADFKCSTQEKALDEARTPFFYRAPRMHRKDVKVREHHRIS